MARLRVALARLNLAELRKRAPVGLVSPDSARGRAERVVAAADPRVVFIPLHAVEDDFIADLDARDTRTDLVDDAGSVRTADVKSFGSAAPLAVGDDIDGAALRCPHGVVVDARGHYGNENLAGTRLGNVDNLLLHGASGRAEAILANGLGVHAARHNSEGRPLAEFDDFKVREGMSHMRMRSPDPPGEGGFFEFCRQEKLRKYAERLNQPFDGVFLRVVTSSCTSTRIFSCAWCPAAPSDSACLPHCSSDSNWAFTMLVKPMRSSFCARRTCFENSAAPGKRNEEALCTSSTD